jgi:hypothetical protein
VLVGQRGGEGRERYEEEPFGQEPGGLGKVGFDQSEEGGHGGD